MQVPPAIARIRKTRTRCIEVGVAQCRSLALRHSDREPDHYRHDVMPVMVRFTVATRENASSVVHGCAALKAQNAVRLFDRFQCRCSLHYHAPSRSLRLKGKWRCHLCTSDIIVSGGNVTIKELKGTSPPETIVSLLRRWGFHSFKRHSP